MAKEENYFLNLIKATRAYRVLTVLMVILIPAAYANKFPPSLLILSLAAILIYSASSIYNAYRDKDYKLPKYALRIIFILFFLALIISLTNKIIFFSVLIAISLGFIYNTIARVIPMGDGFIAGFTHFALPFIFSSLLVGLDIKFIVLPATLFYCIGFFIGPVTNLKDIQKDREKEYHTVITSVKNPEFISAISLDLSFIIIFVIYIFFKLNNFYFLFLIPVFLLRTFIVQQICCGNFKKALGLTRLYLMLSFIFLIFCLTLNFYILLAALSILFVYILSLLFGGFCNGKL
jgi:hypothetical protein